MIVTKDSVLIPSFLLLNKKSFIVPHLGNDKEGKIIIEVI